MSNSPPKIEGIKMEYDPRFKGKYQFTLINFIMFLMIFSSTVNFYKFDFITKSLKSLFSQLLDFHEYTKALGWTSFSNFNYELKYDVWSRKFYKI